MFWIYNGNLSIQNCLTEMQVIDVYMVESLVANEQIHSSISKDRYSLYIHTIQYVWLPACLSLRWFVLIMLVVLTEFYARNVVDDDDFRGRHKRKYISRIWLESMYVSQYIVCTVVCSSVFLWILQFDAQKSNWYSSLLNQRVVVLYG